MFIFFSVKHKFRLSDDLIHGLSGLWMNNQAINVYTTLALNHRMYVTA